MIENLRYVNDPYLFKIYLIKIIVIMTIMITLLILIILCLNENIKIRKRRKEPDKNEYSADWKKENKLTHNLQPKIVKFLISQF